MKRPKLRRSPSDRRILPQISPRVYRAGVPRAYGPEHRDTTMSVSNLARLLANQGDIVGARPLFERTIAIFERVDGPDDPKVARELYNLADLPARVIAAHRCRPLVGDTPNLAARLAGARARQRARCRHYAALLRRCLSD